MDKGSRIFPHKAMYVVKKSRNPYNQPISSFFFLDMER